ncbi:MAG: periplasmic heavy metal sensor [Acidobacteria bacterium]|nr:periplasmic heavy metal sensor [Acidobacteriota bacterium]
MKPSAGILVFVACLLAATAAGQVAPARTPAPPASPTPPAFPHHPAPPGMELGKWWKNSEVVRELGISEAQVSQIEQAFFEQRLKLIDLKADLEKQETKLQPLIEADQPDEAKVSAQIDQVLAARGRLEKANAMMMFSIRRVLSVDQWKKLQEIQQRRERSFPRRPAPPGGFGPQPGTFERPAVPPRPPEIDEDAN